MPYENVDRCVICGDIIPEGGMVCLNCIHRYQKAKEDDHE